MKICIVSDSHGSKDYLEKCLDYCNINNIKTILHAGDMFFYGIDEIFNKYKELNIYIALGNNDVNKEILYNLKKTANVKTISEIVEIKLNNKKIIISHKLLPISLLKDTDIHIFGHTHKPYINKINKPILINPGALCDTKSFIVLDAENIQIQIYKVI